MRRARRINVRLEAQIVIDAYFQDSGLTQTGDRIAIHEYLLRATADRETQTMLSLQADPAYPTARYLSRRHIEHR
jgi:hypothetical protein